MQSFVFSASDSTATGFLPHSPKHGGRGIVFDRCLSLFLSFFVSKITRKRLDRFAWNFQGKSGVTMWRPGYIFLSIRKNRAMPRYATRGRGLLGFRTTACLFSLKDVFAMEHWMRSVETHIWTSRGDGAGSVGSFLTAYKHNICNAISCHTLYT